MTFLLRQAAELLADFFLKERTKPRETWQFARGSEIVIVTVEVVRQEVLEAYNVTSTWIPMEEDAVAVG